MSTTNLNIRTDKELKDQANTLFSELGINMTTAINLFLKTAVREQGIPFSLKLENPNKETLEAMKESERIAHDPNYPSYKNMEDLIKALEE